MSNEENKPTCDVPTLLRSAADWLEVDEKRWTKGSWAVDAKGNGLAGALAKDRQVACVCGEGALEMFGGAPFSEGRSNRYPTVQAAMRAVDEVVDTSVPDFNDDDDTTREDVIAAFRLAAEGIEKGEIDV